MKLPKPTFSKYDLEKIIKENWNEIIELIESSLENWGQYEKIFIEELKKHEINYIDIKLKKEDKEDEK